MGKTKNALIGPSSKVSQIKFGLQEFLRQQNVAKSPQARHVDPLRFRLGTNKK